MPRRSGGGVRRSSFSASRAARAPPAANSAASRAARAPPPAPPKAAAPAPAPARAPDGGGIMSTIADGYLFGTGSAMAHRVVDAVFGRRKYEVEHTVAAAPATLAPAMAPPASSPCDLHAQAFQDCINDNGSDISRCQFYVDMLNDCRRRGHDAVLQASG